MYLAFFDGLDALLEYCIPSAKEYPIAPAIYSLVVALPGVALVFGLRLLRGRGRTR